mmetsp:Transcript_25415/g.51695  ORF Transcript_25415/g.51695 Transcript_25415/m.51695 type:complete len:211 (-) Transcript_25415:34-666(-)
MCLFLGLEVLQHILGHGHRSGVGARVLLEPGLDEHLLDLHVAANDHGISPGALTEASLGGPRAGHAHCAGECACAIGNELDALEVPGVQWVGAVGLLLLESLVQAPLAHDESIVDGQTVDIVNAQGLHLGVRGLVPGQMLRTAQGSECTRKREDNASLAGKEISRHDIFPVEGVLSSNRSISDTCFQEHIGYIGAIHKGGSGRHFLTLLF